MASGTYGQQRFDRGLVEECRGWAHHWAIGRLRHDATVTLEPSKSRHRRRLHHAAATPCRRLRPAVRTHLLPAPAYAGIGGAEQPVPDFPDSAAGGLGTDAGRGRDW